MQLALRLGLVLAVSWHTARRGSTLAADPDFRVPVGQRQLFLDDQGLDTIEGLKRAMHSPRKLGAVIRPRYFDGQETSIQTRSGPQWDAQLGRYRLWLISNDCYESADGLHWTPTTGRPSVAVINAVIDPDDPDPKRRYKGLVSRDATREPVISADGIDWQKLDVPPIPSQDESNLSYDEVRGDELWFYYTGIKYRGTFDYIGNYPDGQTVPKKGLEPAVGAICLAALRRDGFVSLDAQEQPGTVTTQPFLLTGDRLVVNVDAPAGELRVEALNAAQEVVARSAPLAGDLPHEPVTWNEGNLADAKDQTVSLRFTLRGGQFYSYWLE